MQWHIENKDLMKEATHSMQVEPRYTPKHNSKTSLCKLKDFNNL